MSRPVAPPTPASEKAACTTVLNVDDLTSDRSTINFDSDSTSVVCDNSANVHICNAKRMFVGELSTTSNHTVATIGGKGHAPSGMGTVNWRWKDDTGKEHEYLVQNVCIFFNPQSTF